MDISNFTKHDNSVGTCLQAYALIHLERAVAVLGPSHRPGLIPDGKTEHQWCFNVLSEIVTCYYRTDDPSDKMKFKRMHIGGNNTAVGWFIALLFDLRACEWVTNDTLFLPLKIFQGIVPNNYAPMNHWFDLTKA